MPAGVHAGRWPFSPMMRLGQYGSAQLLLQEPVLVAIHWRAYVARRHLPRRSRARAATKRVPVTARALHGCKDLRLLGPLLAHLHTAGTERDHAGHRQLFYDPYATLLLGYVCSSIVTSLRGLQQTTLATVQCRFGVRPMSLGALSEAAQVFDAALLQAVIRGVGPPSAAPGSWPRSGRRCGP